MPTSRRKYNIGSENMIRFLCMLIVAYVLNIFVNVSCIMTGFKFHNDYLALIILFIGTLLISLKLFGSKKILNAVKDTFSKENKEQDIYVKDINVIKGISKILIILASTICGLKTLEILINLSELSLGELVHYISSALRVLFYAFFIKLLFFFWFKIDYKDRLPK
jgi:hypothetical protein